MEGWFVSLKHAGQLIGRYVSLHRVRIGQSVQYGLKNYEVIAVECDGRNCTAQVLDKEDH